MEKSDHKATKSQLAATTFFSVAILVGALMSVVELSKPAYAGQFVYRVPPYSDGWSNPSNTCVNTLYANYCAAANTGGLARAYVLNANTFYVYARAEHNVNPPQSNPHVTVTTPNYVNVEYDSLMHGKFKISNQLHATNARMQLGGWATIFRAADQTWIKDRSFYIEYNTDVQGNGVYTIPSTNVYTLLSKTQGQYGIGSYFWGIAIGDHTVGGLVDAYTTSSGYAMYSDQLSMQW